MINLMHQKGLAPILIILLIAAAIGGYLIYTNYSDLSREKSRDNRTDVMQITPAPTSFKFIDQEQNAEMNGQFEEGLITKSFPFLDSKGNDKKLIIYRKRADDFAYDTYIVNADLSKKSAILIPRLSDYVYNGFFSGFGDSIRNNSATVSISTGSGKRFIVTNHSIGDSNIFILLDENGDVIEDVMSNACSLAKKQFLVSSNKSCYYVSFDNWRDAKSFYVKVHFLQGFSLIGAETFKVLIDANTGSTIGSAERI